MKFKNVFGRKKENKKLLCDSTSSNEKIICDTLELEELITKWTKNEGWKFENFAEFLELINIKTPVRLSNLSKKDVSFKCQTADNKALSISLRFGDFFDHCSEIQITEENVETCYITNGNWENGKTKPIVTLNKKIIHKNGMQLNSYYGKYFCQAILSFNSSHILGFYINNPSINHVCRKFNSIENYLLSLDNSLKVSDVYSTIIKLLDFSVDDILKSEIISVSFGKKIDKKEIVQSKILLAYGKIKEYAITENSETFEVHQNGYWSYHSDNINVECLANGNRTIRINDSKEKAYVGDISSEIWYISEKIEELKKVLG